MLVRKVANIHTQKSAYFQRLAIYFAISSFSVLSALLFDCKQESRLVNLPPEWLILVGFKDKVLKGEKYWYLFSFLM